MPFTIYHNPRCQKSRQTLALLREAGHEPEIIEYLKTPPSGEELKKLLAQLGLSAEEIIRKKEAIFKENYKGKTLSEDEWLMALHENPKLIERPIVTNGQRAVIGRPPENVEALF
jgi:arsenate reductase